MWSVFTLLTPLATSMGLVWIVLVRIALGLGEGKIECTGMVSASMDTRIRVCDLLTPVFLSF
jgi:hypothetical protein